MARQRSRSWSDVYSRLEKSDEAEVRSRALALAVTFGDPAAFGHLRKIVRDAKASLDEFRRRYPDAAIPPELRKLEH